MDGAVFPVMYFSDVF